MGVIRLAKPIRDASFFSALTIDIDIAIAIDIAVEPVYEFHFARYYDDHMVLQRAPGRAVIWGYGPVINDNTSVMVTIDNNSTRRVTYYTTVKYTGLKRLTAFLLAVLTQSVSSMFGTVCRVIQLPFQLLDRSCILYACCRLVRILHCLYLARSLIVAIVRAQF